MERTRTREVRALMNECERLGIRIVTLDDEEYPRLLKNIPDPPIVLFVKGSLARLNAVPSLAVVGPRSPSEYGRNAADKLCTSLAKDGTALISGLAVGIDSVVHRSAVNNGGYTVGVLGCGSMVNYPAENEELKAAIIASGGAVISELLPYTSVSAGYFKRRNRIISGLAQGTLVVEASTRSGCLLTAEHTVGQGRVLMCIPPHDIFAERFSGVMPLLRGGAVNVFETADVYNAISSSDSISDLSVTEQLKHFRKTRDVQPKKTSTKSAEAAMPEVLQSEPEVRTKPDFSDFSPEEAEVITQLTEKPLTMDELIDKTGLSHDKICAVVLGLEINDVITRNQTGTFMLV